MPHRPPDSLLKRLGWFAALWAAGVVTITLVGYFLKLLMGV